MKVIVPLVLVIAVAIVALVLIWLHRPRPELPRADRQFIDDTGRLLARLSNQTDLDQLDVLSTRSKADVARLLSTYNRRYTK